MLVINIRTTGTDSRGYPEQVPGRERKALKVQPAIQVRQNRTKVKAITRAVLLTKAPAIRMRRKIMGIQLIQEPRVMLYHFS